ncbi:carboxypeptidase regulatory-like domain-containing protein [Xylophilus rhododendri]|uniref:Carboxypeptidase regulatory-like domain-containing protein n=1 Tax=Xylophilus rhododendri TaxID=2697032 RepID=A0A857J5C5_9BURK|nr:carboxypeptidase-like regulatory domain-containing protein [Xylophilus rhododendri]QHI99026.1 carboxypeptidase regulatory-like domain-containing protein [Xylophilus rhododendri]
MPRLFSVLLPAATLCCALAGAAHAQSPADVKYRCGGIGSDESTQMREEMKSHPLSLLFAKPDGDYLADVQVSLSDTQGKPLQEWKASGPVCLVDLPPGRYKVSARSGDTSRDREVNVGATPVRLDFRF